MAVLTCRTCGRPATHVHFIPWIEEAERVELACPDHDPGDEWFTLDELEAGASGYLRALSRAGTVPESLVAWLTEKAAGTPSVPRDARATGDADESNAPSAAMSGSDGLLTVAEAARRERCSERTIR